MKKILIAILLVTLPLLSHAKDREFIISYKGTLMLSNFSVKTFNNTNIYTCDIDTLGAILCKAKVENDAKLACQKEIKDYINANKLTYKFRLCDII